MLELLRSLADAKGKALMVILHDINLAARFCDHLLLLLGSGETVAGPTQQIIDVETLETLFRHPIQRIRHRDHDIWMPR